MARASIIDAASAPAAMATVSRAGSDTKTLHVTVGHSVFIDTKTRLRRVYVADPSVLNSVTLTPTEIIVTAMAPGVSSLTLLDEAGQAQSYVISSDIDIESLRVAMNEAMRGDAVKVEGSGTRVTLSGIVSSDAIADNAVKLASLYSKEVGNALTVVARHPKQVRLQVRILEVDRSKALQQGINLFNPGGNTSFLAGTTTSQYPSTMTNTTSTAGNVGGGLLSTSNPLNFMLYSAKLNLGATIQDLESKQVLQILAEPTITTISGKKADFLSGGEFPFPIVQPGGGTSAPVVSIQFRPYGVKVEFTPIVNEDGTINLTVAPEVSALDYTNAVTIAGFTVPALSTRRAETQVELRSSQSFAISGLLDQRTTDILSKNPGPASIPILGYLFKSKNVNHSTTELIVVVTATVVDPLTEATTPVEPDLPIPTLKTENFDESLGKNRNPQPAAPPIDPAKPAYGNQAIPPPGPVPANKPASSNTPSPAKGQQNSPAAQAAAHTQVGSVAVAQPDVAPRVPSAHPAIAIVNLGTGSNASTQTAKAIAAKVPPIVEIMAVSHESDAEAAVAALNRRGYNVAINHDPQNSLLHLDIGPFATKSDAETMRQRLLQDGYDATIK
jgi:pilus assembly protein CpaC